MAAIKRPRTIAERRRELGGTTGFEHPKVDDLPSTVNAESPNSPLFEKPWGKQTVAEFLGLSVSGLDKLTSMGRAPPGFRAGRLRRWRPSVVRGWAERQERAGADSTITRETD